MTAYARIDYPEMAKQIKAEATYGKCHRIDWTGMALESGILAVPG
jgi:hypothetical protein